MGIMHFCIMPINIKLNDQCAVCSYSRTSYYCNSGFVDKALFKKEILALIKWC